MQIPELEVTFDSGETIIVRPKARDLLALEQDGFELDRLTNLSGFYRLAFVAMRRQGIEGPIPETLDEFMAQVDVLPVPEDSGKAQAGSTD